MIGLSQAVKTARLQALADLIAPGTGAAELTLYSGTAPATGADTTDQVALVVFPLPSPIETDNSAGVLTLASLPEQMSIASGTATWARVLNGDGEFVFDINVTDAAGNGGIKLSSVAVFEGALINITSAQIAEP